MSKKNKKQKHTTKSKQSKNTKETISAATLAQEQLTKRFAVNQRYFYLDQLDIPVESQGTNFSLKEDKRHKAWKKQKKKYGFDEREIWNMDCMYIQWIYNRCMYFLDFAPIPNIFPISFNQVDYTLKDAILQVCYDCEVFFDASI